MVVGVSSHVTGSSRALHNRPPLAVERERLDGDQNPSTTHRLCIVAYSLDSISGHFIIQLGQLSHHTPQKRGLQSNGKLHTGPGGDTEGDSQLSLHFHFFPPLPLLLLFSPTLREEEERKEGREREMEIRRREEERKGRRMEAMSFVFFSFLPVALSLSHFFSRAHPPSPSSISLSVSLFSPFLQRVAVSLLLYHNLCLPLG